MKLEGDGVSKCALAVSVSALVLIVRAGMNSLSFGPDKSCLVKEKKKFEPISGQSNNKMLQAST